MTTGLDKQVSIIKPIYDPRRALEHVHTLPGVVPVRLFGILFPLWDVEITATQEEGRPYELLERYIERGIAEGQLHTVEELRGFFGLQREIVEKILSFLQTIGHVTQHGTFWELTPLGAKSIRDGTKYVEQEKHIKLYFDAYTSQPLRTEHYKSKKVHIFSPDEAAEITHKKTWGYRFQLVASTQAWQPLSLRQLEARVDRADYNIPDMQRIQPQIVRPAYIPMYIIETSHLVSNGGYKHPQYLVYTGIRELHDTYFEAIINNNSMVYTALSGEKVWSQAVLWRDWLLEKGITGTLPLERADGTWQISLPSSAFEGSQKKFSLEKVGAYELNHGYFIQLWCDDRVIRRRAVLERVLMMVKNQQHYIKKQTIEEQLRLINAQLQVDNVRFSDLRQRALEAHMDSIVRVLDTL